MNNKDTLIKNTIQQIKDKLEIYEKKFKWEDSVYISRMFDKLEILMTIEQDEKDKNMY